MPTRTKSTNTQKSGNMDKLKVDIPEKALPAVPVPNNVEYLQYAQKVSSRWHTADQGINYNWCEEHGCVFMGIRYRRKIDAIPIVSLALISTEIGEIPEKQVFIRGMRHVPSFGFVVYVCYGDDTMPSISELSKQKLGIFWSATVYISRELSGK